MTSWGIPASVSLVQNTYRETHSLIINAKSQIPKTWSLHPIQGIEHGITQTERGCSWAVHISIFSNVSVLVMSGRLVWVTFDLTVHVPFKDAAIRTLTVATTLDFNLAGTVPCFLMLQLGGGEQSNLATFAQLCHNCCDKLLLPSFPQHFVTDDNRRPMSILWKPVSWKSGATKTGSEPWGFCALSSN